MPQLMEYLEARASNDEALRKVVEQYELEQNDFKESTDESINELREENESLKKTLDVIMTEVIPSLIKE